jgi:hypothetical protein
VSASKAAFPGKCCRSARESWPLWACSPIARPQRHRQSRDQAGHKRAPARQIQAQLKFPGARREAIWIPFSELVTIRSNHYLPRKVACVDRLCISRTTSADFFEASLKFREMRSSPVNLRTPGATPKIFIVEFCKRLELLIYVGFNDFFERCIAAKATAERSD